MMSPRALSASLLCATAAAISAGRASAADGLTTFGYSGLLSIPTASVTPEGYLDVQYNEDVYDDAEYEEHSNFIFSVGLAERLELGGGLTYARRHNGRDAHNDLSANTKLLLLKDEQWLGARWSLAAGWADFSGESAGTQRFEARYLVGSAKRDNVGLTIGYGAGPDRLDGAFGGISWSPLRNLTLMADSDAEFISVGARVAFDAGDLARIYAIGRSVLDKESPNGFGVGTRVNLRWDRAQRWFQPGRGANGKGLRFIRSGTLGEFTIVEAENAAYLQRQPDSASAACAVADKAQLVEYWQYRYGIPLLRSMLDCSTGRYTATAWLSQLTAARPQWQGTRRHPIGVEVRLGVEERSFVGVNTGRLSYSTALQTSARLQTPYGLGGYVTRNTRLAETEEFEEDGLFDFYRVPDGLREYAAQLAVHPVSGLIAVGTLGHTYVNAIEYDFTHVDTAYLWGQGTHRSRLTYGEYTPSDFPFPTREITLFAHRYWISAWSSSVEVSYGDYFYGDSGTTAQVTRHFGDATVSLFVKATDSDEQVAGIAFGIPLTPKLGFNWRSLAVVGMPRFAYSKSTSFGNDAVINVLRPTLLVEPRPIYNLTTDWLDSDRMSPAHASYSAE